MLIYPEAVVRLQRTLQGQGVGKDAEWASVLRDPLFAGAADCGGSASLAHLLDIWVERQHLLWKVGGRPRSSVGYMLRAAGSVTATLSAHVLSHRAALQFSPPVCPRAPSTRAGLPCCLPCRLPEGPADPGLAALRRPPRRLWAGLA